MEDKKQLGMILTIATILLCGCPGLCFISSGILFSFGRGLEDYGWEVTGNPQAVAIPLICIGVIGLLITVGAGVYWFMQARKQDTIEEVVVPDPLDGELNE